MVYSETDIKSMLPDEIAESFKAAGYPKFRVEQVFRWLSAGCSSWEEMTNIPKVMRAALAERYTLYGPKVIRKQVSQIDGTIKYLWELSDGNAVETVLMRYHYGNSICISTQVGCRQGCAFCASTIGGLVRQLSPSEMLDEVLFTEKDSGLTISNIVLMGIGEPLDNFQNVMQFLRLINHEKGRNIGMRHISLSTCGLTEHFQELMDEDLQITLSVSLHAPDDETRNKIMPVNRNRGVEDLIQNCVRYYQKTGRRISFEYAMIRDLNDQPYHAQKLAKLVKPLDGHVNLIPLNYVEERKLLPSSDETVAAFVKELTKLGVNATVRRRLGSDVDASCGQLRRKMMVKQ